MRRGGLREGAGRPAQRLKAESAESLDIRVWARAGIFTEPIIFSVNWDRGGRPSGCISVFVRSDAALLRYRIRVGGSEEWQDRKQVVKVKHTVCNFGGVRKWFKCPECSRRCELLYFRFGSFACRLCQKIAYRSQSGDSIDRLGHKLRKLEAPIQRGRPTGMHRTTFKRKRERAIDIELSRDQQIRLRLAAMGCEEDFF